MLLHKGHHSQPMLHKGRHSQPMLHKGHHIFLIFSNKGRVLFSVEFILEYYVYVKHPSVRIGNDRKLASVLI